MMIGEQCAICGRDEYLALFEKRLDYTYDIIKCSSCGLVTVYPKMSHEEITSHYNQPSGDGDPAIPVKDLKRTEKKRSRIDGLMGELVLQARRYPVKKKSGLKAFLGNIAKHFTLKELPDFRGEGRILDVGCNNGLYLYMLGRAGWDVYGLDIDARACKAAAGLGIKAFAGPLHDARYPDNFFDVVRLSHVLEHVESPSDLMKEVRRILKPDGIAYVLIPNQRSFGFYAFKQIWQGRGGHLYAFSGETFGKLAEKHGFLVYDRRIRSSPGALVSNILLWCSYRKDPLSGFLKTAMSLKILKTILIRPFCVLLNSMGYGDIFEATIK